MKILAIDTSAKAASAAICEEDKVIAEYSINTTMTHSQTIMPMIDSVLKLSNNKPDDIDYWAISNGPGSFTGLRIGIATVKGMTFTAEKPCVSVSTLASLAENCKGFDGIVCAAMDARCNQVYTALFNASPNGEINRITNDSAITIDNLKEQIIKYDENIFLVGDGAELCYNSFKVMSNVFLTSPSIRFQSAASVAFCAFKQIKENQKVNNTFDLIPSYLRLSQAERELNKKNNSLED